KPVASLGSRVSRSRARVKVATRAPGAQADRAVPKAVARPGLRRRRKTARTTRVALLAARKATVLQRFASRPCSSPARVDAALQRRPAPTPPKAGNKMPAHLFARLSRCGKQGRYE